MSVYYPGCPDTITKPLCSDCPPKELGDIRSIALLNTNSPFVDITDTSEWTTKINASNVFVFPYTRGGLEITENEVPGFGNTETDVDGYSFVANVFEPNYVADFAFWNSIKNSKNYHLIYRTETQIHLTDNTVSIITKAPIEEGNKKVAVNWNLIFKFEQEGPVQPSTTPTGVFDVCIDI